MARTIVGLFDDFTTASKVVQELTNNGIPREEITVTPQEGDGTQNRTATTTGTTGSGGSGGTISNFFSSLFGSDANEDADHYSEAVRRGSALVTVNAEDNESERIAEIMNHYGAVDINHRAEQYRASGFTNYDANAPMYTAEEAQRERETYRNANQGEVAIPVVEEELRIGKRAVQRGGVRIYNRVTERPVEETVSLREEHVNVERRPVDRAVSEADVANLREGVIEVTEMAEEAVVNKQARVVEEVVVNKEIVAHDETIRDTVRRTDVEVEEIDGQRARGRSTS